jgi:hypothetical protein
MIFKFRVARKNIQETEKAIVRNVFFETHYCLLPLFT